METLNVGKSSGEAVAGPDPSWRGLYKAGAISAVLYVVLNLGALVLLIITPPAPSSGGAAILQYIASHMSAYLLELVLFVAPCVFAMVVFLALYMTLRHLNKSFAAIAALVAIASQVVGLPSTAAPRRSTAA